MGKKKPKEMAKQRAIFIQGAAVRGIPEKTAEHIFDLIEKFAGYGFNKSHSAAYALITYQTAWLKTHYPAEFMAAVLSADMDNTDKIVRLITECRAMELPIQPPDINKSHYHFTVNDRGDIEYGLGAVKGVGESAAVHLVKCREQQGIFKDLFSVCRRLDSHKINRRALEALIRSGSLDSLGVSRTVLLASMNQAMQFAEQKHWDTEVGQQNLFALMEAGPVEPWTYVDAPEWSDAERLQGEKETLGLYISGHPLEDCEKELTQLITAPIGKLESTQKNTVVVAGVIVATRALNTRLGKRMAILTVEDRTGRLEVTLFSDLYQRVFHELSSDHIFLFKGSIAPDEYTGGMKMVADTVLSLDQAREQMAKRLLIRVHQDETIDRLLTDLPGVLRLHEGGRCPIMMHYQGKQAGVELTLGKAWRVKPSGDLLTMLQRLCGKESVFIEY